MSHVEEIKDKKRIEEVLKEKEDKVRQNIDVIEDCLKAIKKGKIISIDTSSLFETIAILCEDARFKIDDAAAIRTVSRIDGKDLLKIVTMKKKNPDFFDIYK